MKKENKTKKKKDDTTWCRACGGTGEGNDSSTSEHTPDCKKCGGTGRRKKKQKHTRTKREFAPEVVETKDFSAKVVPDNEGRNMLRINAPVWYRHQLSKFRTGETVTLFVSSRRPKRTIQQNRYYWGVYLPLIAKETGEHDLEALHRLFAGKYLSEGIKEVLGQKVRITKSTTSLSKADFSEYIMSIEADTGIMAPPTENYFD